MTQDPVNDSDNLDAFDGDWPKLAPDQNETLIAAHIRTIALQKGHPYFIKHRIFKFIYQDNDAPTQS